MKTSAYTHTKLLAFAFACLSAVFSFQKAGAQIDTIFKYGSNQRLMKLWLVTERHIYGFDSLKAANTLDSVIDFGEQNGDKRLAWYARYFKLLYKGRQYHDAEKEIVSMQSMKDWVDNCPLPVIQAAYKHTMGNLLFVDNKYGEAFNLMLQAQHSFEQIGYDNIPEICEYVYELANDYYGFGDYTNSLKYIKQCEPYYSYFDGVNISKINTEALAYRRLGKIDSATIYFQHTIDYAGSQGNTEWVGIASGNLAYTLMVEGKYQQAIPYLIKECTLNKSIPDEIAVAAVDLAECYIKTGNTGEAKNYILLAQKLANPNYDDAFFKRYYRSLASYYAASGDLKQAYSAAETYFKYNDSLNIVSYANTLEAAETRVKTENYLTGIAMADEKQKSSLIIRNIITVSVAIVLCLLIILIFIRYRVTVQKQQLLHAEKQSVDERLQNAESELMAYIRHISERNELNEKAAAELQELQKETQNAIPAEKLEILSTLFQFTILTDDDWNEFKKLFDVVHPHFLVSLRDRYPSLTPAEKRLLALLKLKLSNKEMSAMIGVSYDTVVRSKHRLRKKLSDLNIDLELEQFVGSL